MHKAKKSFGTKDALQIRGLTSANLAQVQGGGAKHVGGGNVKSE